ncbi:YraN family protein [Alsobacter soli]|uniref:YraN family protein n=1 Tax=Alsobacter soli TaxID=2109933 RepID=UPI0024782529|nr:YraN family protein [Alsobacter soli]
MASRRAPSDRRAALRRGMHAEIVAAAFLLAKGYRILAWRYAGDGGEIDLVCRRGAVIAFVEVKQRADLDAAGWAIGPVKQQRFQRAARRWIARNPWASAMTLRCDAVLLAPWRWPRHIPDAFTLWM